MSHYWASPQVAAFAQGISPFVSPRQKSTKRWYPSPSQRHRGNWIPSQKYKSPYTSPSCNHNGYKGTPTEWSPSTWQPPTLPSYCKSWVSSSRIPQHRSFYHHSPKPAPFYKQQTDGFIQDHSKTKTGYARDISQYYSPAMMEDPWAQVEAEATQKMAKPS